MLKIYHNITENKSKFYFYTKILLSLLVLFIWLGFFDQRKTIAFKVLFFSTLVFFLSGIFWQIISIGGQFKKPVARFLFYIDISIIFAVVYPLAYDNYLFSAIPLIVLIAMMSFFEKSEITGMTVFFFTSLTLAAFVYGVLDVLAAPLQNYAANLILAGLVFGIMYVLLSSVQMLQNRQSELIKEQNLLKKTKLNLERELQVTRRHSQTLDKGIRRKDMEIKNILTLSGQLSVRDDSRKVLSSFLLTLIGQVGGMHAAILTRESKDKNYISVLIQKGLRAIDIDAIRIYLHSNLIQILKATREPILIKQIPRDNLYVDEINLLNHFKNDIICPIFIKGYFSGALLVGNKLNQSAFTSSENNLISILANQSAFILEQDQMTRDYQGFYAKTMRAMLNSLEAKYVYARGHNVRTANYVNIVAKKIGLSAKMIKDLSHGTLLHDVGKIAVKDEYLLNTAKFSDNEAFLKEKILQHALEGSKILKSAGFNDNIVDMALHHHEFYNGKGYPHQIGKNELSIGTRVLSVCNAFDAMTSDRPHRKALSAQAAVENLRYNAGDQFDPEIVSAFLSELKSNPSMQKLHRVNLN